MVTCLLRYFTSFDSTVFLCLATTVSIEFFAYSEKLKMPYRLKHRYIATSRNKGEKDPVEEEDGVDIFISSHRIYSSLVNKNFGN